jgi:hypothetical protein
VPVAGRPRDNPGPHPTGSHSLPEPPAFTGGSPNLVSDGSLSGSEGPVLHSPRAHRPTGSVTVTGFRVPQAAAGVAWERAMPGTTVAAVARARGLSTIRR